MPKSPSVEQDVPGRIRSLGDDGCDRGNVGDGARDGDSGRVADRSGVVPPPRH
jgi:hypothetical protein